MLLSGGDAVEMTAFGDAMHIYMPTNTSVPTVGSIELGTTSSNVAYWHIAPDVPTKCSGDVHVWVCEHAKKCKCGEASRKRPACEGCGK